MGNKEQIIKLKVESYDLIMQIEQFQMQINYLNQTLKTNTQRISTLIKIEDVQPEDKKK